MKISDRFTDYGLIGGGFWLMQLAVWLVVVGRNGWSNYLQTLTTTLNSFPAPAIGPLVALLGAIGLIAVFTTGLLLDILGSWFFRRIEMIVFDSHARQHSHWFQKVADLYAAYLQEDWSLFISLPPYKTQLRESFRLWPIMEVIKNSWLWPRKLYKGRQAYVRLQSFLLSYVLLSSGVEKLEPLSTQMALWNTGRALAAGFIVSSLVSSIGATLSSRNGVPDPTALFLLVGFEVLFAILGVTVAVASYGRVCGTLFALVYLVSEKGVPSMPPVPMSFGGPSAPKQTHDE